MFTKFVNPYSCLECEVLKDVSINRSVLSSEKQQSSTAAQGHQKSVWQGRRTNFNCLFSKGSIVSIERRIMNQ